MATKEDIIIAKSFKTIKAGILEGDWQKICDAYEAISDEKLDPPNTPKKTRLEEIRELIDDTTTESEENEDNDKDVKKTKKKNNTKKQELIELEVISDPYNPKIAKKNQELLKDKPRVERTKKKRDTKPKDNSSEDASSESIRYYDKPLVPAPWHS